MNVQAAIVTRIHNLWPCSVASKRGACDPPPRRPRFNSCLALVAAAGIASSAWLSGSALAAPIGSIDVGDSYYINNLLSENDYVVVVRIDRSSGLVKVRYASGGTDWVRPSQLLTRSQSRTTDAAQAVVGTAIAAGIIWKILDPDGFDKAMRSEPQAKRPEPRRARRQDSGRDRQASVTQAQPNAITAPAAIPFAPVLPSDWTDEGADWVRWTRNALSGHFKRDIGVGSVRTKTIPFYSSGQKRVVLVEAAEFGHTGAYYIMAEVGTSNFVVLSGSGKPIHDWNERTGFRIQSNSQALAYLLFFSSAIAGEDGIFLTIDPYSASMRNVALGDVRTEGVSVLRQDADTWVIGADSLYGDDLFRASFRVKSSGKVEMIEDEVKASSLGLGYSIKFENGRRYYASHVR